LGRDHFPARTSISGISNQSQPLETLGQLAPGIAHDYNNLLAVILGYAGLILHRPDVDDTVRADVLRIQAAAQRAVDLTRQLLVLGRLETVVPQELELNALVTGVHARLETSVGAHVQVDVGLAQGLPAVRIDRGQLEQALLNLAANASDAMPDGGTLTISTSLAGVDESHVRIVVGDTGAGMPPEVVARASEPFFTTKSKGEGTGLGLSTVHSIVTDAGGTVRIDSAEGAGTTVTIDLPAVTDASPPGETPSA
jgi:signal transduction histidine kinase